MAWSGLWHPHEVRAERARGRRGSTRPVVAPNCVAALSGLGVPYPAALAGSLQLLDIRRSRRNRTIASVGRKPAGPRTRGRPKGDDALPSETILAAALRTFATYGYEGASLRTINRELGVSHNLTHQRFGTKEELWRAAVDFGFGGLVNYARSSFDPTVSDPIEQLRMAVRRFVLYSAGHPELLALMSIEGRQNTDRLRYIYDTYIEPSQRPLERLLKHLAAEGKIRDIPYRTFFFLFVHGGASSFTLAPLATLFDPSDPADQKVAEQQADLVATIIVEGLRLPDRR